MGLATFYFVVFPELLMQPFHPTPEMLEVGIPIFRTVGIGFILSPLSMICSSLFQGLGNGTYSLIVTTARQIVIRIPLAYFLAQFGDMGIMWFCWPISDFASDIISLIFYRKIYRERIKPMGEVPVSQQEELL